MMEERRSWMTMMTAVGLTAIATVVGAEGFQVVVHPSVEGTKISRSVLAGIYQRQVTHWGNQTRIVPVDQSSQSPVRQSFTQDVMGRSLGEVQNYWKQRMAMHRQLPPSTKPSDEAVLAFIAEKRGAIGYVSGDIELPPDVKAITVID